MRLIRRSVFRKVLGRIRYFLVRCFFVRRICGPWKGYIDSDCKIFVYGNRGRLVVGSDVTIGSNSTISTCGECFIGSDVHFTGYCRLICHDRIEIGDGCRIAPFVTMIDHDHDTSIRDGRPDRTRFRSGPISIGRNVWLGEKVTVLKGVTIGENSVVGANSVVTKSIPANCIAGGVPSRVIRMLDPPFGNFFDNPNDELENADE